MARQALYRTYRPQRFQDVVGQDAVVAVLRETVRRQQFSHAYLFTGPRGTGKTSLARILARAATCDAPDDGEPCGRCPSCLAAEQGGHLDIIEIDGASNRGIDDVRDLREKVMYAPAVGRRKVYIVDEIHMMTEAAFNAFLKTLEEPPAHVLFIFATTAPQKLPITVLSRCQRFEVRRISAAAIVRHLRWIVEQEGATAEAAALERIAGASDGGMRDAESLLDQVMAGGAVTAERVAGMLGGLDDERLDALARSVIAGDAPAILATTAEAYQAGADALQLLREVAVRLEAVWMAATVGSGAPERARLTAARIVDGTRLGSGSRSWFSALEGLAAAESRLRGAFPAQLVVELALVRAAQDLNPHLSAAADEAVPPAPPVPSDPRAREADEARRDAEATEATTDPPAGPAALPARDIPKALPAPAPGDRPEAVRFAKVQERLRKTRPMTAALLAGARAVRHPDALTIYLTNVFSRHVLEQDVKSGHQASLRRAVAEEWGEELPVRFADDSEGGPAADSAAADPRDREQEAIRKTRAVLGDRVTVTIARRDDERGLRANEGGGSDGL